MTRLLSPDIHGQKLTESVPAGTEIVAGTPTALLAELTQVGGTSVGLWEMTAGTARDVEDDELFIVLSGDGRVEFDDGEAIELGPGVMVRLSAGDRTRWTVRQTLRKLYLAPGEG